MISRLVPIGVAALWVAGPLASQAPPAAPPVRPSAYAITNVTIVPVVGARIVNGTIVIRNGRIEAAGAGVATPAGATVINGSGLFVYPGLIDSGDRMGLTEIGSVPGGQDTQELGQYNPQNDVLTAHLPEGMPIGPNVYERAAFTGYFFKVQGYQAAGAGLLLGRQFHDAPQTIVGKQHLDSVRGKGLFVLADDTALGSLRDRKQVLHGQVMANHAHGQPADELRLETELDEVPRLDFLENRVIVDLGPVRGGKANVRLAHALADDFFQSTEGATHHKEDVPCVDHGRLLFSAAPRHLRADAGHRQTAPRCHAEAPERLLHEPRGLRLLEAHLGLPADALADAHDLLRAAVDRREHLSLQLVPGHGSRC